MDKRPVDKRSKLRFDKVFPVAVSSPIFGDCQAIARNISEGGIFLEMSDPLPLGSEVRIHFAFPGGGGEIALRGEVKGHYYLNFADTTGPRTLTGMGVRFIGGEDDSFASLERNLSEPLH